MINSWQMHLIMCVKVGAVARMQKLDTPFAPQLPRGVGEEACDSALLGGSRNRYGGYKINRFN